jgi:hypothetical protein
MVLLLVGPYRYAWAGTYEERGTYLYVKKGRGPETKEEERKRKEKDWKKGKRIGRGNEEERKRKET